MNDAIVFPTDDAGPRSLAELEARLARDFDFLALSPPAKDWLEARAHPEWGPVLDIAIVGASVAGLSACRPRSEQWRGSVAVADGWARRNDQHG